MLRSAYAGRQGLTWDDISAESPIVTGAEVADDDAERVA